MNVLISGHAGTLGKSFTNHILNKSWKVFGVDIHSLDLLSSSNIFEEFKIDISDEKQVMALVKELKTRNISLDGIIHFASLNPTLDKLSYSRDILDQDVDSIIKSLKVGVLGTFSLTKHLYNVMKDNSSIIFVGSDLSLISPNQKLYCRCKQKSRKHGDKCHVKPISYSIEKAALLGMTRYLATFFAEEKGIRVNCVCIGPVDNGFELDFRNRLVDLIPLGRPAFVGEYNETFEFLLSTKSSYITGAIIPIDGGRTAI